MATLHVNTLRSTVMLKMEKLALDGLRYILEEGVENKATQ